MSLSLTPVSNKSPNHKHGCVQLTRNGTALNVCHSFASKTHHITVGEMAALELNPNVRPKQPRIVEKTGRKLARDALRTRWTDVTEECNQPAAKLRLIPSTGLLKGLEPSQICVLQAAEYYHDDGTCCVKAAYSIADATTGDTPEPWNRLVLVTCAYPGPNRQPSKAAAEDYYLWSTGMQAVSGWWLELRERCAMFCNGMGGTIE
jgi:hypothetical protein